MSFPSHDPYWVEVATFLDTYISDNDDILAPKEFEYRFVHCFPYTVASMIPASGFQWVVVHKGMLDKLNLTVVLDALKRLQPVYTNAVFVVLGQHPQLSQIQEGDDLIDFNQKLRILIQNQTQAEALATGGVGRVKAGTGSVTVPTLPQNTEIKVSEIKVSIITICLNAAQTIETTLQQVAQQTYPNLEYIVVDGGSEDGTLEICDRYSSLITTLVSEPDTGVYNAMNKGIARATGEFLYFANADDYLFDAQVIQDAVAFIQAHPNADVVYGDHEARYPASELLLKPSIHTPVTPDQMLDAIICFKGGCLLQPASFFRRTTFEQVGHFSEQYGIASDYKWFLDALQVESITFEYYPRTIVSYAHGGRSGNIPVLFSEIFDIHAQSAICQQEEWVEKRTQALQQDFINKYNELQRLKHLVERRDRHLIQLKQRTLK